MVTPLPVKLLLLPKDLGSLHIPISALPNIQTCLHWKRKTENQYITTKLKLFLNFKTVTVTELSIILIDEF